MAHLNDEVGLSEHARELKKWDLSRRDGGMRPDTREEFPRMLYKAIEVQQRITVELPECQRIVRSEQEFERAVSEGWCVGPTAAKAALEARQEAIAQAAAEKAYSDRRMSAKAQAEAAEHDAEHQLRHVPDGPTGRRPGRSRKADSDVSTS